MTGSETLTITTLSDREVLVTREFAAPPALILDAMTKPEMIKRWYGLKGGPWTSARST